MPNMVIFWGVRGSIATPGPNTAKVGGNTSCVEVRIGGELILLDGGTGLRQMGLTRCQSPLSAHLLFSHLHWDHIKGIPFFVPLYHPNNQIKMIGPTGLEATLGKQMSSPTFPVNMDMLAAKHPIQEVVPGASFTIGEIIVSTAPTNHPGGGLAYRFDWKGHSVVYATDTEHPPSGLDPVLLRLAQQADVLIYDAQYLPEEYSAKVGWGHSTYQHGAHLAQEAGVKTLFLFHHDPLRDDGGIRRLEKQTRQIFPTSFAAREGMMHPFDAELQTRQRPNIIPGHLAPVSSAK